MKLRERTADLFLYGGISKEKYLEIVPVIRRKNRETLMQASVLCAVMFAALTIAGFFSDAILEARLYYIVMTVSCVILVALSATVAREYPVIVLPMWYLLYLLFGGYAVFLNTMIRPQLSATTLCAFLVAAPLLIIDRPWRVSLCLVGLAALFGVCAHRFKEPFLAFADGVNVVCCLFIGAAIYTRLVRGKLREIIQAALLERERDMDGLTGLLNKAAAEARICTLLSDPRRNGTLVVIDIDGFKQVNDTYGHAFGDFVLQRTAECIRAVFPEEDLCSRFGGDEFVLYHSGTEDTAKQKMNCLMERLKKEIEYPAAQGGFSISAGMASAPRDGQDYLALFRKADQALYTAKRMGKDRWLTYSEELGAVVE